MLGKKFNIKNILFNETRTRLYQEDSDVPLLQIKCYFSQAEVD